jgi:Holliday junction resolvase RusA-like endonuclease
VAKGSVVTYSGKFTAIIPMRCATKKRPVVTRRGTHMPDGYTAWKRNFAWLVAALKPACFGCDVELHLDLCFHNKPTGDADNYAGAVMDALTGVLWTDDRQIKRLLVSVHHQPDQPDSVGLRARAIGPAAVRHD